MEFFKKREYYDNAEILKKNALYNLVWGGRNAGKSTSILSYAVAESYKYYKAFGLVWRYEKKNAEIEKYLNSEFLVNFYKELTDGYEYLAVKAGEIFFVGYEDGKKVKGPVVGYVFYLSKEETYKSLSYDKVYNIIFEEFVTREPYLIDEPTKLESLISTVFRNRIFDPDVKVWLIGNLISRVNPYVSAWGLEKTVNQKEDSILIFDRERGEDEYKMKIRIAAQRCRDYMKSGIAIGLKAQQQETAQWETDKVPLLSNWRDYENKYEFVFTYMGFYFLCRFLKKGSKEMFIYIERKTTPIKEGTRVIGDIDSPSILYTATFKPLVEGERIIFNLIEQNKLYFCDALTGTDFYNCLETMKRGR